MKSQLITGVIAGNFDVIHPGYIDMFAQCKDHCSCLIVLLHEDPSVERSEKCKPILSVVERMRILNGLRNVDIVIPYKTEKDLYQTLQIYKRHYQIQLRFLGDDYIDKSFTGDNLDIPIHYLTRDHGWSTTKYKQLIANSLK
jgi:glycerol-3-phosphate cytidylyltransferase